MRKVAIVTQYYNSKNYGGNLQAYALNRYINSLGFESEQLCYQVIIDRSQKSKLKRALNVFNPKKLCSYLLSKFKRRKKSKSLGNTLNTRHKKIEQFNRCQIDHSEKVYDESNIRKCIDNYDIFVAGSDQIWNLSYYFPAYFLEFVPKTKIKVSYAASVTMDFLTNEQKNVFKNHLKDYSAISVREREAVSLLADCTNMSVEWVLDPTMLLTKNQWEKISSESLIDEPYIFCYFLGSDENERNLAKQFANKRNFKIATIPYLNGYNKSDDEFGEYKIFDAGVEDFLSLIRNAEYVFTDSFHAVVFSGIFEKQYVVFQRAGSGFMASRIYTLCELYETQDRFCDTKERATLKYIEGLENIDYQRPLNKLNEMKEKSKKYLKENLK